MIIVSDSVLVESKSARDNQLERVSPKHTAEGLNWLQPCNRANYTLCSIVSKRG